MAAANGALANVCNAPDHAGIRLGLRSQLACLDREVFVAVFLDAKSTVIQSETMFFGNRDFVLVTFTDIARAALRHGATALLVAHNHTTSSAAPSAHDVRFTRRLSLVMAITGIPLLDHVIVSATGDVHSMADLGPWEAPLQEFAALLGEHGELHAPAPEGRQ